MRRIVNQHPKNDNQKKSDARVDFYALLRRQGCDNRKICDISISYSKKKTKRIRRGRKLISIKLTCSGST